MIGHLGRWEYTLGTGYVWVFQSGRSIIFESMKTRLHAELLLTVPSVGLVGVPFNSAANV